MLLASISFVSGDLLPGTGAALINRDLAISGVLQTQIIEISSGSYVYVTGSDAIPQSDFYGLGGTLVFTSGDKIFISGAGGGDSVTQDQLDSLSGYSASIIDLEATGSYLDNLTLGLSGSVSETYATMTNLGFTGSNLYNVTTGLSGTLTSIIANTGQAAWRAADNNASNLSGNLTQTGIVLNAKIDTLSGYGVSTYAQTTSLTATGVSLGAQINSLSGFTISASGALQTQIAAGGSVVKITGSAALVTANFTGIGGALVFTSGNQVFISGGAGGAGGITQGQLDSLSGWSASSVNLATTGSNLYNLVVGTSGQLMSDLASKTNLALTGSNLYNVIIGASGQSLLDFATKTQLTNSGVTLESQINSLSGYSASVVNLASTGQQSWSTANNNALNLSGNLTQTGASLFARDASISGALNTTIGISGSNLYVLVTGLSGQSFLDYTLKTNVTLTGQTLDNKINALSGYSASIVNLALTGSNLYTLITNASGASDIKYALATNLALTGSNLYNVSVGLSGQLVNDLASKVSLASTGQQAWSAANSNSLNLSGNLTITGQTLYNLLTNASGTFASVSNLALTGSNLYITLTGLSGSFNTQIASTGSQSWNAANNNGINLSGNLTNTGITLTSWIVTTSGNQLANAQNISGRLTATGQSLSAVIVTGSSIINLANFTGFNGIDIFRSGNFICITGGGSAGPGGGVSSLNTLDGDLTLQGSNISVSSVGTTITLSGSAENFVQISGDQTIYNVKTFRDTGVFGDAPITQLPSAPLQIASSGNFYLQTNLENFSTGNNASADYVITASDGTDSSYYIDLGLNNPGYNQSAYSMGTGHDGYLYVNGGDLTIATQTTGYNIQFYIEGTQSNKLVATVQNSGVDLPSGKYFSVNNSPITNFSRGGSFYNLDGINSGLQFMPIWYAPYTCRVTGVRGYIISGTSATVNAYRNFQNNNLLISDINVNATGAWVASGIIQAANLMFNPGDTLGIQVTQNVNNPVSIAVQVELMRS